jgi:6-phosphofructokinase 1
MATILRQSGTTYAVRYDAVPLREVANSERHFPAQWIAANGYDVTDDFVRYCRPLVGDDMVTLPMLDGRQRLTRLKPTFASQKLPHYLPQAERE